jgi:hypothetical protein
MPFAGAGDPIENKVLRKLRERREAEKKAEEEAMETVRKNSYALDHDHVYQHAQSQKEYERNAEKEAKESLLNFTRNGKWLLLSHSC